MKLQAADVGDTTGSRYMGNYRQIICKKERESNRDRLKPHLAFKNPFSVSFWKEKAPRPECI